MNEPVPNFTPYPRAMYHKTLGCVIVADPGERLALGAGWYESLQDMARAEAAAAAPVDEAPVAPKRGRKHDGA